MTATTAPRQPLIGVMCCNRIVAGRASQTVANRFLEPLARISGASVMVVPAIPGALDPAVAVRVLDGLLLTGSCSNVSPMRYGSAADDVHPDHDRDETVARIAGALIDAGRPILGICRGMQEINVLFGGTLDPHADHGFAHHAPVQEEDCVETLFSHGHDIEIVPHGRLDRLFGARRGSVNSVHHQGVARLGAGLTAEAHAPDGLVEAFHARPAGADVLAVQWHPEYDAFSNPYGRAFFEAAGRALRGGALTH